MLAPKLFPSPQIYGITSRVVPAEVPYGSSGKVALDTAAMMDVSPGPTAMTCPLLFTVATEVIDELQEDIRVISWVDPSVYVPIARNCWKAPTGMDGTAVTDDREAEVTVRVVVGEKLPKLAVIVVVPVATAVARPVLRPTVATDG